MACTIYPSKNNWRILASKVWQISPHTVNRLKYWRHNSKVHIAINIFMYNYTQMLILHNMFCAVANECIDVEGVMHKNGEAYMGPDKCNTCKCMNGKSACTK
jgi:hypothetical protein